MTAFDSTLTPVERPPSAEAWGPGITLAVLVHVALVVALAFGVHWRSSEPAGIEAELWAAVPQVAAPKVETVPRPVEPTPLPKVEPPPPPPPPQVVEPPQPTEAEIAIEKAREDKLKREQLDEQQRREQQKLAEEQKRRQAEELKKNQAAAEREEQRKRELDEQRKREQEEQRLAKQHEAEERRLAQQREENLERLRAQAGGTGAPSSTGSAARSAGPSAGYAGRIVARVKPNIVFGDDPPGNPAALVEVRAAADGTIVGRRLVRSSGVKEWDEAVLRAIDRTETLPRDIDGRVPATIEINFRQRE